MALDTEDYLLIVNSIMDAIELKEQQKSQELISEKLNELNMANFQSNAKKQSSFVLIIARLKMAHKKLLYKANIVDESLKDTWILLSIKIDEKIELIKKEKARHARSHL